MLPNLEKHNRTTCRRPQPMTYYNAFRPQPTTCWITFKSLETILTLTVLSLIDLRPVTIINSKSTMPPRRQSNRTGLARRRYTTTNTIPITHPTQTVQMQPPKHSTANSAAFRSRMPCYTPSTWATTATTMSSRAICAAKNVPIESRFSCTLPKISTRKILFISFVSIHSACV